MAVNILDLFKNQVIDQLAGAASGLVGESESATKGVLETLAPTLLGSLINKGSTESGASSILNMLSTENLDSNILSSIGNILSGDSNKLSDIMNIGGPIVKSLLGDKLGSVIEWVSGNSQVKSSSVSSLLSLAAPFLLGLLGKQVKSGQLNLGGLMGLLGSQSEGVNLQLPSGLSNLTNFALKGASTHGSESLSSSTKSSNGGFGKILPMLLLLLGLVLLYYFMKGCNKNKVVEATSEMVDNTVAAGDSAASAVKDAATNLTNTVTGVLDNAGNWVADLGNSIDLTLPGLGIIKVGERSVEKRLVDFIIANKTDEVTLKNTWFSFDRLYFETGKSNLTVESKAQLENIAKILKAYPNVHIKLGGYTDADGDAANNIKLSETRAKAAMTSLQTLGIGAGRLSLEGYGKEHPICAANDTPECKAQNRRIDIRITKM